MAKPMEVTDEQFEQEVLKADLPVMVDFWAAWCGPCRAIGPTIEELAKQFDRTVKVGKLNIDENPQAPSDLRISSIPAEVLAQRENSS